MRAMLMALVLGVAMACGGGDGGAGAAFEEPLASECGGFGSAVEALASAEYCAAEVLDWAYDAETAKLSLLHQRTTLNCCGDHAVSAAWDGDAIVVTSVDEPQGMGGRCSCMCVFDFALTIVDVPAGSAQAVRWHEDVTDDEEDPRLVFDGTLDLSAGAGRVVLSDAASMWCEGSQP